MTAQDQLAKDTSTPISDEVFDASPTGMALLSARPSDFGRFIRVNPATCELLGRTEDEMLATDRRQVTFAADAERGADQLASLLDGTVERTSVDKRIVRPDGCLVWVQVDTSVIRDPGGEPLYLVGQVQDVSERHRRDQQLDCERAFRNALTDCVTAEAAVTAVLPELATALDCEVAVSWLPDEEDRVLRAGAVWSSGEGGAMTAVSREIALERDAGLPARVWKEAKTSISADISGDPACPRSGAAKADGLVAAVAFPLVAGDRVLQVAELMSSHSLDLDDRLIGMLDEAGQRLGAYLARQERDLDLTGRSDLLLVEDDPFIASLVQQMLAEDDSGLTLRHADSLAAARKEVLTAMPACVLLDLTLPDANGLQGLLAIRKLAPDTPIVVLTAHEDAGLALRAVQEGAQDYLVKRKSDMESLGRSVRYAMERKRSERLAAEAFLHDRVTGLPNRGLLTDRIRVALGRTGSEGRGDDGPVPVVLFHVDIEQFRLINDSLGHETGDAVLEAVARRLSARVDADTTVGSLGADKFAVLATGLASSEAALGLAERLLEAFSHPIAVGTDELEINASIGIAVAKNGERDAEALLHDADIARSRAKELGSPYEVFDENVRTEVRERLKLNTEMRKAVSDCQLRLHYQPIVTLNDGKPMAMEALVRWQHPERGLLQPGEFLAAAEENSLIVPMGEWILSEACGWLTETQAGSARPLSISVNISPVQVRDPNLVRTVRSALAESGISPAQLWLEITESALIDESEGALETLVALKELGITLVLDDFGTGYSSLSYLRRFPIDVLKIDRTLVTGLDADPQLREIVTAVLSMGEALGMVVVAEGVESYEDINRLKAMGCWLAQGYYFARPLPGEEAARFLTQKEFRHETV